MAFLWFGRKKEEAADFSKDLAADLGQDFGQGFDQGYPPQQRDDLGLPSYGQNASAPEAFSPYPQQSMGQSFASVPSSATQRQFGSSQPYQQPTGTNRDIDLLASKLDAIKATLDAIDQRLKTVERLIQGDEGYKFKKGW